MKVICGPSHALGADKHVFHAYPRPWPWPPMGKAGSTVSSETWGVGFQLGLTDWKVMLLVLGALFPV